MDKRDLFKETERIINGEQDGFNSVFDGDINPQKLFFQRTAIRLVKNYQKYMSGQIGTADYLAALRNFLLVFNMPLKIKSADYLKDNVFGIYLYESKDQYMAAPLIPSYIPHPQFVEDAFVSEEQKTNIVQSPYSLQTSPFIFNLTGFPTFKSITIESAPLAIFLLIIDDAINPILETVPVTSLSA